MKYVTGNSTELSKVEKDQATFVILKDRFFWGYDVVMVGVTYPPIIIATLVILSIHFV